MEETLRALYKLQQIDLELDDLDAGSGDLPGEVERLEAKLAETSKNIEEMEQELSAIRKRRTETQEEVSTLRGRTHELNDRLKTVRNNKEYDATTSEIESAETRSGELTSTLASLDNDEAEAMRSIQSLEKVREEMQSELESKKETLETIQESSRDEIDELRNSRTEVVKIIPGELFDRYKHIRTAHDDAVVKVRKGACSGCYRAITPQTLVEMRKNEQLFYCEHCGRMLVDEEIAESIETLE